MVGKGKKKKGGDKERTNHDSCQVHPKKKQFDSYSIEAIEVTLENPFAHG
jgi:hypothetical protein